MKVGNRVKAVTIVWKQIFRYNFAESSGFFIDICYNTVITLRVVEVPYGFL